MIMLHEQLPTTAEQFKRFTKQKSTEHLQEEKTKELMRKIEKQFGISTQQLKDIAELTSFDIPENYNDTQTLINRLTNRTDKIKQLIAHLEAQKDNDNDQLLISALNSQINTNEAIVEILSTIMEDEELSSQNEIPQKMAS